MKIAFLTEIKGAGKIPKAFPNMRTEFAWMHTLGAVHHNIELFNSVEGYDHVFIIFPKGRVNNQYDVNYYQGMFMDKPINVIPTLMIEELLSDIIPIKQDKVIIGGNFAHWYGGFESYVVAGTLGIPIWAQDSHAKREYESEVPNLNHLPRLIWVDWMKTLSEFKYAVHLMPTVAAGTFSLNCAYFSIPCIGNELLDTQRICHPELSVDVSDLKRANKLIYQLHTDKEFYNECSRTAKENYHRYYSEVVWKDNMNKKLQL